jgi:hypothetical protein
MEMAPLTLLVMVVPAAAVILMHNQAVLLHLLDKVIMDQPVERVLILQVEAAVLVLLVAYQMEVLDLMFTLFGHLPLHQVLVDILPVAVVETDMITPAMVAVQVAQVAVVVRLVILMELVEQPIPVAVALAEVG